MGLQIRDERQMKALTGLSQAQFDSLLPVFSDIYRATQQHTYEEGSPSLHAQTSPVRWVQRETANHGREITICPLLL